MEVVLLNNMWRVRADIKLDNGRAGYVVKCECGYLGTREKRFVDSGRSTCCKSCSAKKTAKETFTNNTFFIKNHKGIGDLTKTRFGQIKRGATRRNLDFNVSLSEVWELFIKQNKKCALSGLYLDFIKDASLDRIDNNKGYIIDNIQWIHKDINFMKQDYDENYFILFCKLIAKNNEYRS